MDQRDNMKHRAYIGKIGEDAAPVIRAGLEFIQWEKYIDKKTRVFIKPNFTNPTPEKGVTTTPAVLKCLLEILVPKAGRVIVGESDGGNNSFTAEESLEGHDMYRICEETGAEAVSLSKLPSAVIEDSIMGKHVSVELPRLLLEEIDCFITVPVFKVHVMTTVTVSLKNSWGCLPDTMRGMHHQNIAYKLALIASRLKPKIVVVDGTYSLNRHGPMFGEPVPTDMLLVADNTVAADGLGATLMGFEPRKIKHIAVAEKAGLGSCKPEDVELNTDLKPFRRQFVIEKTFLDRASAVPFTSDRLSKLIFQSPLTPLIYKVVGLLRTPKEKEVADQMGKKNRIGPY